MHIVCPHCTTSYAIDPATLGGAGRTVRCSRCKEVWLARPEDAVETAAPARAMAAASQPSGDADAAAEWDALAREDDGQQTPVVDSPSISADWPDGDGSPPDADSDWQSLADAEDTGAAGRRGSWFRKILRPPGLVRASGKPVVGLPTACAAMGALVVALIIWRVDMVRL